MSFRTSTFRYVVFFFEGIRKSGVDIEADIRRVMDVGTTEILSTIEVPADGDRGSIMTCNFLQLLVR